MEVKFENVSYINNRKEKRLNHIQFTSAKEKVTVIMGKNGSGKSVLAQLLSMQDFPSDGMIYMGPFQVYRDMNEADYRHLCRLIGVIEQYPERRFVGSNVREEIAFGMKQYHYKQENEEKHILAALKMVEMDPSCLEQNPFSLSMGEKKKIALASQLAYNPSILIFDEPTVGLDSTSKQQWIRMIRMLKRKYHKTVIVLTQDSNFAIQLADQVILLHHGKVFVNGKKMEVFRQVKKLHTAGIAVPYTILFSEKVLERKQIKIGYRDDINDLIKDVYRHAR